MQIRSVGIDLGKTTLLPHHRSIISPAKLSLLETPFRELEQCQISSKFTGPAGSAS
jgi:hypothetical protein